MKRFIYGLILMLVIIFCGDTILSAQEESPHKYTINSYYPAVSGSYKSSSVKKLRLIPRKDINFSISCGIDMKGKTYFDGDEKKLFYCNSDGAWGPWGNSVWEQDIDTDKNDVYLPVRKDGDPIPHVGIGTDTPKFRLTVGEIDSSNGELIADGGIVALGKYESGDSLGNIGEKNITAMIWNPRKAAFRAGVSDGNWGDDKIGGHSTAFGYGNIASGDEGAFAMGSESESTNHASVAVGYEAISKGAKSMAFGLKVEAYSHAETVFGLCNEENSSPSDPSAYAVGDNTFSIGNGVFDVNTNTCSDKSNAITFKKPGYWGIRVRTDDLGDGPEPSGEFPRGVLHVLNDNSLFTLEDLPVPTMVLADTYSSDQTPSLVFLGNASAVAEVPTQMFFKFDSTYNTDAKTTRLRLKRLQDADKNPYFYDGNTDPDGDGSESDSPEQNIMVFTSKSSAGVYRVGVRHEDPQYTLDVDGTIRACRRAPGYADTDDTTKACLLNDEDRADIIAEGVLWLEPREFPLTNGDVLPIAIDCTNTPHGGTEGSIYFDTTNNVFRGCGNDGTGLGWHELKLN